MTPDEVAEEVSDTLARGAHPKFADLDREALIHEAKKTRQLSLLEARLLVALEDAHARLARLEK